MSTPMRPVYRPWLLASLAAAASLLCYLATLAPGLTWAHDGADGGDLIAACVTGGVPHPSGYPTYCLLARAFTALLPGDLAWRYNLFSAFVAALSVGLAFLLIRRLLLHAGESDAHAMPVALGCSLVWGLGSALWSQAVITEVYALHALSAALLIWGALSLQARSPLSAWLGLGMAAGLGLGNHLTLALILPGLAVWLWPLVHPRRALVLAGGLGLGLCAYLYVPLAARGAPPIAWGDPRDWEGFWWLVSGKLYRPYLFATPLTHLPARLASLAALARAQYTLPGLALVLLGIEAGTRTMPRRLLLGSALVAALPALYALGYNTTDSYVYLLPTWLVGTLWLAMGVAALRRFLQGRERAAALLWLVPVILAAWLLAANGGALNLREDAEAQAWLVAVVRDVPPGALLITGEDRHTFALDYLQWAEGRRPDLLVVDGELWAYPWYRRQVSLRHPAAAGLEGHDLEALAGAYLSRGPVYLASRRPALEAAYAAQEAGIVWELVPRQ